MIGNPDGTTLVSGGGSFFDVTVLPATGTYTILVDPFSASTGSVTLTLYDVPDDCGGTALTPTASGDSATATVSTPGQNCQYTFVGSVGQKVSLLKSSDSLGESTRILSPNGTTLASASTSFINTERVNEFETVG